MAAAIPANVDAEGEHARRAGAELQVLLGDAGKLQDQNLSDRHVRGLRDRILGSLSSLPLLLRLADQERGASAATPDVGRVRLLLAENRFAELAAEFSNLSSAYPFRGTGILSVQVPPERIKNALRLHKTFCSACHDFPFTDTERPAFRLYDQAKLQSAREFAARMVTGIRGDVSTGLDNPFTDEEIAALLALYRTAESTAEAELR
ncbi:MAG: hypothetical protein KDI49_00410 [Gammaproteobacteria bacterium]|nr:hypothetical protein [Gammaproteobacteria bacterium]